MHCAIADPLPISTVGVGVAAPTAVPLTITQIANGPMTIQSGAGAGAGACESSVTVGPGSTFSSASATIHPNCRKSMSSAMREA